MFLSSEYRHLRAVLDAPESVTLEEQRLDRAYSWGVESERRVVSSFSVGPFKYLVIIVPKKTDSETYYMAFKLDQVQGTPDELRQVFSRVFKRDFTPEGAVHFRDKLLNRGLAVLGVGNAGKVLGHVLAIARQFDREYQPYCIYFTAAETSRIDLYRSMVKRYFPRAILTIKPGAGYTTFYVFPRGEDRED